MDPKGPGGQAPGAADGRFVEVVGVPMDMGTHRLGVDMGPNALRYAGLIPTLRKLAIDVRDHGDVHVPTPESRAPGAQNMKYVEEIAEVARQLAAITWGIRHKGGVPVVLGGDHSVAIGSIAGVSSAVEGRLGLVWVDAHPDCNTPETTESGNVHGMALAAVAGLGGEALAPCLGAAPAVDPRRVCILGAKDIDPAEREMVSRHGIEMFTIEAMDEIGMRAVMEKVGERLAGVEAVYVSLDLDVIDPTYAPGVGIRSRGGLTYREIRYLCKHLGRAWDIAGMDVVELNPLRDQENQTANLAIELVIALLGRDWGDYQRYLEEQSVRTR